MKTLGRPTDTSLRHVHAEMKKIAIHYLSSPAAKELPAEEQIARLCTTCQTNSHVMSMLTQALGKTDKAAMREHIAEQVRHTLADLAAQSLVVEHSGSQNYMLTGKGWDHRSTLDARGRN